MAVGLLEQRRNYSAERLEDLKRRISAISELLTQPNLSIYVTGSYGRFEAHEKSDLDVFFVTDGSTPLPKTIKTLIDAQLIRIVDEMKFPPFSNDAQYLENHILSEILEHLGGPEDDFRNHFTARMLLLLESRCLHNEEAYRSILTKIIDSYFRDYHDHTGDFRPLFLVNDILRFWKTLCLNFESRRNLLPERAEKNKHHLKNLKLKFSRLLICFSTVIPLVASRTSNPEDILALTGIPPLERIRRFLRDGQQQELYNRLAELYSSFLVVVARADVREWIGIRENRRKAFAGADEFGEVLFNLLSTSLQSPAELRFLVL